MSAALTTAESARLEFLEDKVEAGLKTFVEVGTALAEIRDGRLYRETHGTFEDYCRERWGMSKRHANRHIGAAQAVSVLGPNGPVPTNEAQARPLTKLPPEEQREAWKEAVETAPQDSNGAPKVTAKHVAEVVERKVPRDKTARPEREVVSRPQYTAKLRAFVRAAIDLGSPTDDEIAAIPANEIMMERLATARDTLDRILTTHTED